MMLEYHDDAFNPAEMLLASLAVLHDLSEGLAQTFCITHSTLRLERGPCGASCPIIAH